MSENEIIITVNGQEIQLQSGLDYGLFKAVEVTKSLDALCGSFSFTTSAEVLRQFQINKWDNCVITVNGQKVINGYVCRKEIAYDDSSHDVTISGYDVTKDLVDTSLASNVQYNTPISLDEVISTTLTNNGMSAFLPVETAIGFPLEFREGDSISGDLGQSIFEFLDKCARKLGCILGTNQDGKIKIYRNDELETSFRIDTAVLIQNKIGKNKNSLIKSASFSEDVNNRFSTIEVVSQGGLGGMKEMASQSGDVELIGGLANDNSVPRQRYKTIIADDSNDQQGLITMAQWEANKRRSDSIVYSMETYGFSDQNGTLWQINNIYNIDDDFAFIRAPMLIKSVVYTFNEDDGSTTNLNFVTADAYTLQVNDPKLRENKKGSENESYQ